MKRTRWLWLLLLLVPLAATLWTWAETRVTPQDRDTWTLFVRYNVEHRSRDTTHPLLRTFKEESVGTQLRGRPMRALLRELGITMEDETPLGIDCDFDAGTADLHLHLTINDGLRFHEYLNSQPELWSTLVVAQSTCGTLEAHLPGGPILTERIHFRFGAAEPALQRYTTLTFSDRSSAPKIWDASPHFIVYGNRIGYLGPAWPTMLILSLIPVLLIYFLRRPLSRLLPLKLHSSTDSTR